MTEPRQDVRLLLEILAAHPVLPPAEEPEPVNAEEEARSRAGCTTRFAA